MTMHQQELPLSDQALTQWFDAGTTPPPMVGWWEVRVKGRRYSHSKRRWWDGQSFGLEVLVGVDSDETTEDCKLEPSMYPSERFEYRGLINPPKKERRRVD